MPTCLECGFTAARLQWTHFRYKCTGKFKNGVEYLAAYPGASVVDSELAKRSAVTKDNMISKYGEEEGLVRWGAYREKQRLSNSFEYKQEKHGWTREQFDEFNQSRAVTREKCIERHGEEAGNRVWDDYREAQRYTNTVEYFIKKYGDEGRKKWEEYNQEKGKSMSIEWIMEKHQVSVEEAEKILAARMPTKYTSQMELQFIDALELDLGYELKYTAKTKQFCMWNKDEHRAMFFDIVNSDTKKIVEFHGDYWHCNPSMYQADFYHPHAQATAKEIWHKDYIKTQTAIARGYQVMVVWEKDYRNDSEKTIKEAKEWLTSSILQ